MVIGQRAPWSSGIEQIGRGMAVPQASGARRAPLRGPHGLLPRQRRGGVLLRHAQERDVLTAPVGDQGGGPARGRGAHRGLLQPPAPPTRPSATRSRPSGWRPSWNGRSGPSRRTRGRCRWPPRTDRLPVRYIETDQRSCSGSRRASARGPRRMPPAPGSSSTPPRPAPRSSTRRSGRGRRCARGGARGRSLRRSTSTGSAGSPEGRFRRLWGQSPRNGKRLPP